MSLFRKIAHNTLIQIISRIVGLALSVIVFALLTRNLSSQGFGEFSTIIAFVQFFAIIGDLGLSIIAIQFLSEAGRKNRERDFQNVFTLRTVSAIILYTLAPLISFLFPYSSTIRWGILFMSFSFFLGTLSQIISMVYQVNLKMIIPFIADFLGRIILIIGIPLVFYFHLDFTYVLLVIILNNFLQFLILLFYCKRYVPIRFACDIPVWKEIFKRCWPLASSIACTILYFKTDTLFLSVLAPVSDVGLYGAAYRVLEVLIGFPSLFLGLVLSHFSKSWSEGNHQKFKYYYQKSFDFIIMMALPLLIGTPFVAVEGMEFISGKDFAVSGHILSILIIGTAFIFLSSLYTNLLTIIHKQKRMLIGFFIAALVGLTCYSLFIPRFSYWAASWITVGIECFVALFSFSIFTLSTRIIPSLQTSAKIFASSLLMGLFLYAFPSLHIIAKLGLATTVYALSLIFFQVISKNMIKELVVLKQKSL